MAHLASIPNRSHLAGGAMARTRLEATQSAPALARRFARSVLAGHGADSEYLERAELLVSELVTNAVVHAGTPVDLSVSIVDGSFARIEVEDEGGGRAARRQPGDLRGGNAGYGLWLVDSLAESWGVEHRRAGHGANGRQKASAAGAKTVWLHLPLPA